MKRYFVETDGYNMVIFADQNGKCYVFYEQSFNAQLTLETAQTADYSNCDGCKTAEEIMCNVGTGEIYDTETILNECENFTEF